MATASGDGQTAQPVAIEGRSMVILYGTETGNSEEIAGELGKMAERLHFQTVVDDMDSFKLTNLLRACLVVFVTSTTGQGDMPKNTAKFWRNLRREKLNHINCLTSLNFAIFGLGDSAYPKFNWAARKLRVRLLQLGASEFFRFGEADERHDNGIDSIYLPWYQDLRAAILASHPLPDPVLPIPEDVQLPPKYSFRFMPAMTTSDASAYIAEQERRFLATKEMNAALTHIDNPRSLTEQARLDFNRLDCSQGGGFPATFARQDASWERTSGRSVDSLDKDNILTDHPKKYLLEKHPDTPKLPPPCILPYPNTFHAVLRLNQRVTPEDHWQDVRRLIFDVKCPKQIFPEAAAGVCMIIYPKNYPEDVQELITLMDWESVADVPIEFDWVQNANGTHLHIPRPGKLVIKQGEVTLRDLLTHTLDITSIPKRSFIKELVFFTKEPMEKERLRELTALGNEQEFYDYTSRPRRTTIELLRDFPGVKIPVKWVLDLFPPIRGREFSICNGGEHLVADVPGFTFTLEILVALVEYKTIIRKPRQGLCSRYLKHLRIGTTISVGFRMPQNRTLDCSRGENTRPLIAIATGTGIAPIRALIEDRSLYKDSAPVLLFFGCRNEKADFYFRQEWEDNPNVTVFSAFSRDPVKTDDEKALRPYDNIDLTTRREFGGAGIPVPAQEDTALGVFDYDAGKNYVQHQIRKHAGLVGRVMRQQPLVCICGNSGRMPISVRAALRDALVISGTVRTPEDGDRFLQDQRRMIYWQETW